MDSLDEMDKFLEKYNFQKLHQEEIEDHNRHITTMEIETVIRNLPANNRPGPNGVTTEFYQKFREELTAILLKRMSIKSVMPFNNLILCCPLLLLPSIFFSIRVFSNESVLRIR